MSKENRTSIRIILVFIYIGMTLLLIPWLPIAVWSLVILADPIREFSAAAMIIEKVIPFFIVAYPLLFVHGAVSSWRAVHRGEAATYIITRAIYPLLLIIPVLIIAIISLKQ
jgi:hypothetical protein